MSSTSSRLDDVSEDESARWMPAFLALLRTHARLKDQLELDVRRISGLTVARYDVLMHLDMAGGRLRLSDLAQAVVLSPSGLSKLLDRMQDVRSRRATTRSRRRPLDIRGHHQRTAAP